MGFSLNTNQRGKSKFKGVVPGLWTVTQEDYFGILGLFDG
jgi:hypothetical protein